MAAAQFPFNGQQYQIDDQGTISQQINGQWQPVPPLDQNNVALNQAAAAAQAGGNQAAAPSSAAGPGAPPTTPIGTTIPWPGPTPGSTGSPEAAQPPAPTDAPPTPTIPQTPPRAGVGSATELRTQRAAVQKQIDELTAIPVDSRTPSQNSLLSQYEARATSLTEQITKYETPPEKAPKVVPNYGTNSQYDRIDNGDGTITYIPRPGAGQITPEIQKQGNNLVEITPPTAEEVAANPHAPAHVRVAYTDTDAQKLAELDAEVAKQNANTATAAQATNDFAAHMKATIDDRVSRGEDAKSVRDDLTLQLEEKRAEWTNAVNQATLAQAQLRDYETNRHNVASETLTQAQIDSVAKTQAMQDETTRRGQDIGAQTAQLQAGTSKYTADVGAQTARMQLGAQYLNNAMTLLTGINRDLPIGSDLAAKALPGLLAYGQTFMKGLAGDNPTMPGLTSPGGPTDTTNPVAPKDIGNIDPLKVAGVNPTPITDSTGVNGYGTPQGYQGAPNPNVFGSASDTTQLSQPAPAPAATPTGGLDWLYNSPASPIATPANTASQDATTQALASQNAASHQSAMAQQIFGPATRDGTPLASAQDVMRAFGRAA